MYMKSVNDSFCFYYEGVETTFEDELALYLDEDVNAVRLTIQALLRYKLITVSETIIQLYENPNLCVGSESFSAERVRKFRERERLKELQCNTNVTNSNTDVIECNVYNNKENNKDNEKIIELEDKYKNSKEVLEALIKEGLILENDIYQDSYEAEIENAKKHFTYGEIYEIGFSTLKKIYSFMNEENRFKTFKSILASRIYLHEQHLSQT